MNDKLIEQEFLQLQKMLIGVEVGKLQDVLEDMLNKYADADIALKEFERKYGGEE